MSSHIKLLTIISILLLALITGCTEEDLINNPPDINPLNTDWEISFMYGTERNEKGDYSVLFSAFYIPLNHDILADDDTAVIAIDGIEYPMIALLGATSGIWTGVATFDTEATHEFKFIYNGQEKAVTMMKLPSLPTVQFPATYDPTQNTLLSWQLSTNSQYQFAGAEAYNHYTENSSDYSVNLSPSARSMTIPADAITDLGSGTEYNLQVGQMNFKRVGRISFSGFATSAARYGFMGPVDNLGVTRELLQLGLKLRESE